MNWNRVRAFGVLALSTLLAFSTGCSSAVFPSSPTAPLPPGSPTGPNVQTITVNGGPATADGFPYPNGAFTSITICVPGSTTQCQTIDGILIDTGSYGLRIQASVLTLSLPQQLDSSNNPIVECGEFGSGFTWGPVQTTDLTVAGEKASSLPIQVMGSPNFPDASAPTACTQTMNGSLTNLDSVDSLGANGILGVGPLAQDCGNGCTVSGAGNPGNYYSCSTAADCNVTAEALVLQVVNPVTLFPADNNGVIIELPAVSAPTTAVTGVIVFGIGTETNNTLGNASIFDIDPATGNFTAAFNGVTYTDQAFIDSGSDALFFLDPATTGLPECQDITSLYCPASNTNLTATNEGFTNGTMGLVNFTVGNGDSLTSNGADNAVNDVAGLGIDNTDGSLFFDWGMPFFYGRNIFSAIEGQTTPAGNGPFWAY